MHNTHTVATLHLEDEKLKLKSKIADMEEEIVLIGNHLTSQSSKHKEIDGNIAESEAQIALLSSTLHDIEQQKEKAKVFVAAGSDPSTNTSC